MNVYLYIYIYTSSCSCISTMYINPPQITQIINILNLLVGKRWQEFGQLWNERGDVAKWESVWEIGE